MAKETPTPANELERRKQLKIRMRADLGIEAQKYEGRTYYVVKDPVSMRYYRLKDHEYFLVKYMDGKTTLDDAQKAYETRYRPDRLKLEELEGFAQQLLTAGLAHNESPKSGKQLFDRRKKRLRSEWMQTLTNILYIKIPVFDPDRLLTRIQPFTRFIFTIPFFLLSVGIMLAAAGLVGLHFEAFRQKLPDYHEFFQLKTVAFLWIALGCVKVIHEFGHGISCKRFGGEVHEMGALLLCFSPALYCNVSDAWTLPNKWHRIIISAAGIYVELIIAALSTFVWWHTAGAGYPFIANMSLSLMVVCSVSTVIFNANPLMRYDGYYVLADWLEIPNLRERSNRYMLSTVQELCLGMEVPPEEYMALWRRIMFVLFAVISYVYRWVVTFMILFFFSNFLKPYKLEIVGQMLTFASLGTMLGWPLWRLGKSLHRRGRLPDMKRWRVVVSCCLVAALLGFICLVPVPIGRIRSPGLVETQPDATTKVFIKYTGKLDKLLIRPGQHVNKGDELAVFSYQQLERELAEAVSDMKRLSDQVATLEARLPTVRADHDRNQLAKVESDLNNARPDLIAAEEKVKLLRQIKGEKLVLRAPTSGIIGTAPDPNDLGKLYEVEREQEMPFCTIIEEKKLRVCLPLTTDELNRLREVVALPSAAALETIHHLRQMKGSHPTPVTVKYTEQPLGEILADLQSKTKGIHFEIDPDSGLSPNLRLSYTANNQTLADVLDRMFARVGLGYIVVSDSNSQKDGWIEVRPGRERVFPDGPPVLAQVPVTIRIQGRGSETWQGRVSYLPESEAKEVPLALSNKAGGPVPVKAERNPKTNGLIPQTQYYLVYIDILNPDDAMAPGTMAQVKIKTKNETCLKWLWRTVNTSMELRLM